jgi:hypothetical protein
VATKTVEQFIGRPGRLYEQELGEPFGPPQLTLLLDPITDPCHSRQYTSAFQGSGVILMF